VEPIKTIERIKMNYWYVAVLISMFGCGPAADVFVNSDGVPHAIMRPSQEMMDSLLLERKAIMEEKVQMQAMSTSVVAERVDLSSLLSYPDSARSQGSCGDCWVWSNTGSVEILLASYGARDPLSIQYINSGYVSGSGNGACCGGLTSKFIDWYNSKDIFISRNNTNADFVDGDIRCGDASGMLFSNISTTPRHPFVNLTMRNISTRGVSQQSAIDNIKGELSKGNSVVYDYYLPNSSSWGDFYNFWDNSEETSLWGTDDYNGLTWDAGSGGGHSVLIVGYDSNYWIVKNSWGTSEKRPNGVFRLRQNLNYDASLHYYGSSLDINWFTVVGISWNQVVVTSSPQSVIIKYGADTELSVTAAGGNEPYRYQWFKNNSVVSGATARVYKIKSAKESNSGTYFVSVADANSSNANSDAATVTVLPESCNSCSATGPEFMASLIMMGSFWFFVRRRR